MEPMEEKKYEFVLGVSDLGGFEILEHILNPRPHEIDAGVLFYVNDWSMGDGDGHPALYDLNRYKTIPKSVYEKTMKLFRETGDKMDELADDAEALDRDLQAGDYLYLGGSFIYVISTSNVGAICIRHFGYDWYDLNTDEETDRFLCIKEWLDDWGLDEDMCKIQVINKEIYEMALNIAKSGVLEVKSYLKNSLTEK